MRIRRRMSSPLLRMLAALAVTLGGTSAVAQDEFSRVRSRASVRLVSVPPKDSSPAIESYGLTRRDYESIVKSIPRIELAVPVRAVAQVARRGESEAAVVLVGTTHQYATLENIDVATGRFITERDIAQRDNVVVIDARLSKRLFDKANPIGNNLRIGDQYFLVVGVLAEAPNTQSSPAAVYTPLSTMRSRFGDVVIERKAGTFTGRQFELTEIRVKLPHDLVANATAAIRQILSRSHAGRNDYRIDTP